MANNMEVGKHGRVDQYGNPIVVNSEYAGKHQAETIPSDDPWKEWRNLEANPPKFAGDTLEEQEAPVEQPATTIQVDKDNFGLSEGFKDTLVKVPNKEIPKTDGEVNEDDLATGPEPETTSPSESTAEITEPVPQEELVTENNNPEVNPLPQEESITETDQLEADDQPEKKGLVTPDEAEMMIKNLDDSKEYLDAAIEKIGGAKDLEEIIGDIDHVRIKMIAEAGKIANDPQYAKDMLESCKNMDELTSDFIEKASQFSQRNTDEAAKNITWLRKNIDDQIKKKLTQEPAVSNPFA